MPSAMDVAYYLCISFRGMRTSKEKALLSCLCSQSRGSERGTRLGPEGDTLSLGDIFLYTESNYKEPR